MARPILEQLREGAVLGDGGHIVELERRGYVVTGAFTPEVALTHPNAVRALHEEESKHCRGRRLRAGRPQRLNGITAPTRQFLVRGDLQPLSPIPASFRIAD